MKVHQGENILTPLVSPRPWAPGIRSFVFRYGLGAICVAGACLLRSALTPLIADQSPFVVLAPAALLAARFGGLGPGLAAIVAGILLSDYFFSLPARSWGPYGVVEITLIASYTVTTGVGVLLLHFVQHSRAQAEAAAEQARRRGEDLAHEVAERQRAEADLRKAQDQLRSYARELEHMVEERTIKLQESLRSLEAVLYHIAHDLRAPLRAMQGFTSLIAEQYAEQLDATGQDYAQRVSEAARRMDGLLRDLLEYGRICQIELIPARIDLNQAVHSRLKKFSGQIERSRAQVQVDQALPFVWADAHLLDEALTHLISNALKFVPSGTPPQIHIRAETRDGTVRLWIEDHGLEIAPEHHERIFRIFERLHPNGTYSGTGIGLAIVKKAMQRLQGEAGAESRARGNAFWLDLPSALPALAKAEGRLTVH